MQDERRDENKNALQTRQEVHRVRHFLVKVGVVYAALSVALFFAFSALITNHAYQDMSRYEIRHIAEMVFDSMYSAMIAGEGGEVIREASARLSESGPGMQVSVIRGQAIDDLFGENRIDMMRRLNDPAIFQAFKSGNESIMHKDMSVRFLYPAIFQPECQQCHTNAVPEQVAAVVEIVYPLNELKVSTEYVKILMLAYFISSFLVLIIFLKMSFRR
jgi:hypothetical protein